MTAYHISDKKATAREETIIKTYRKIFNCRSIPNNKQYWTLSAVCSDKLGNILPWCELDQVLKSELITIDQFHGVDRCAKIIRSNRNIKNANWYHGSFFNTLAEAVGFNPAIINYDSTNAPELACITLLDILTLCANRNIKNVMVIGNIIIKCRRLQYDSEDIVSNLSRYKIFDHTIKLGDWKCVENSYMYFGSGKNVTKMMSVIFYNK